MMPAHNMHREDVKALVRKRGKNLSDLAVAEGLEPSTTARSLSRPIPAANHAIAEFLGLSIHELWPEWYDKSGQRIYAKSRSSKSIAGRQKSHCEKAGENSAAQGGRS